MIVLLSELMNQKEWEEYITPKMREQYKSLSTIQSNTRNGLEKKLNQDYHIHGWVGRGETRGIEITKRESPLSIFEMDKRHLRNTETWVLLACKKMNNYILDQKKKGVRRLSLTRLEWLSRAGIIIKNDPLVFNQSLDAKRLEIIDAFNSDLENRYSPNEVLETYRNSLRDLNDEFARIVKRINGDFKKVPFATVITADEESDQSSLKFEPTVRKLSKKEMEAIQKIRESFLANDDNIFFLYGKQRMLSTIGRFKFRNILKTKFGCGLPFLKYELDLTKYKASAFDLPEDVEEIIFEGWREKRTKWLISKRFQPGYDTSAGHLIRSERYFEMYNALDKLIGVDDKDQERIDQVVTEARESALNAFRISELAQILTEEEYLNSLV